MVWMTAIMLIGFSGFPVTNVHDVRIMNQHGFSTSPEDIVKAIDAAFEKENVELFRAVTYYLSGVIDTDIYGEQVAQRFSEHAETPFKDNITYLYLCFLGDTPRVLLSKYACDAYQRACHLCASPDPHDSTILSLFAIRTLAKETNITFRDLLVKLALTSSLSLEIFYSKTFSTMLVNQCSSLTPDMAYYIWQRYHDEETFQPFKTRFEEQCGPLISGEKQPELPLENLLKELDKGIESYGQILCEKYKDVEPKPYDPKNSPKKIVFEPSRAFI